MIINEARSVDLRNQRLGDDKAETLHGCGHGSSVAAIIEPQNNMGGGYTSTHHNANQKWMRGRR